MARDMRPVATAAVIWAMLFAAAHFYWGVGGCLGFDASECEEEFQNSAFAVFNLISGVLCLLGAFCVLALFLTDRFAKTFSILVLIGGALLTLRGVVGLVQDLTMITNEGLQITMIYDPWFLLGGLLFLTAGYRKRRTITKIHRSGATS